MSTTLAVALATLLWTIAAIPLMWALSKLWRLERTNFKGKKIPAGFGFLIVLTAFPIYGMFFVFLPLSQLMVFPTAVIGFGIIGLLDDIYGTREAGGFKGHLGLLLKGPFTDEPPINELPISIPIARARNTATSEVK